nr:replication protein A 70 kDa DNA-binding subunit B-like [Ipomoea batatas]
MVISTISDVYAKRQVRVVDRDGNVTFLLWDRECAKLIGMASSDLHAKYPKLLEATENEELALEGLIGGLLAAYMGIAKQRHGIDLAASQTYILRGHDSELYDVKLLIVMAQGFT